MFTTIRRIGLNLIIVLGLFFIVGSITVSAPLYVVVIIVFSDIVIYFSFGIGTKILERIIS